VVTLCAGSSSMALLAMAGRHYAISDSGDDLLAATQPPITRNQVELIQIDSVATHGAHLATLNSRWCRGSQN